MKIRNGFVSNSSSTSFSIWGVFFETEDALLRALGKNPDIDVNCDDENQADIYSFLDTLCVSVQLGFWQMENGIYIGEEWCNISDNETGKEFKDRIDKAIKNILPHSKEKSNVYNECEFQ